MASERLSEQLNDSVRRVHRKPAEPSSHAGPQHPLITLQRQVGNAAVDRLLRQQSRPSADVAQRQPLEEEEEMLQPSHDPSLQRQSMEEEEEMVQSSHDPSLQRQSMEEEEEMVQSSHDPSLRRQEEEMLQMSRDGGLPEAQVGLQGGSVGPEFEQMLSSSRGGGSPVDDSVRDRMESALGTDFDDVRVHRDAQSDSMARNVTASAFTTGNDIFLRNDKSPSDSTLMSHELTHVVQQRSMGGRSGGLRVGAAGDAHEQEADEVSHYVNSRPPEVEREREA
jgi:Domain of unknown function (DUF4157)